jgi:hypothetical protein
VDNERDVIERESGTEAGGAADSLVMPFSLEIWEKKTISVTAGNYSEAVKLVPSGCMFESVRMEGAAPEDRLTEYDWCYLCCQPMLHDKNGPVDRWAKIEVEPDEDCPFWTSDGIVHEACADSLGKKVLERMRA